jgi:nucleoside-diphosphate-sugar epimerase
LSGDLQNASEVMAAIQGIDAVFHVASRVGIWGDYDEYYRRMLSALEMSSRRAAPTA